MAVRICKTINIEFEPYDNEQELSILLSILNACNSVGICKKEITLKATSFNPQFVSQNESSFKNVTHFTCVNRL